MTVASVEPLFAEARAVADAVLFEGYVLYPYRASARKNVQRWQFGVLLPASYATTAGERSSAGAEMLLEVAAAQLVQLRLRFLHVQRRTVRDASGAEVAALDVGSAVISAWDEGVVHEIDVSCRLDDLVSASVGHPFTVTGGEEVEQLLGPDGQICGSVTRTRATLRGTLLVAARTVSRDAVVLSVVVSNDDETTPASREEALPTALVGAHVLAAAPGGRFLSLVDPPTEMAHLVGECRQDGLWPVLVGTEHARSVLASPIILYDDTRIAPESPGELYDGLEIDEILSLRTLTLTDDEKAEARGTDPRAAAIIDRVDAMPAEVFERLHGAIRSLTPVAEDRATEVPWWDPASDGAVDPLAATAVVGGRVVRKGDRVVLRPGRRGSDAQDLFLVGRPATIHAVHVDVDDRLYLAVTVDDDPATPLQLAHGRFLYFRPDEVELAEAPS